MTDANPELSELNVERLRKISEQMIDAIASPPFVDAMRKLRDTPQEHRLSEGARLLSTKALSDAGVPLPSDMRISSRYFEPGKPEIIEGGDFASRDLFKAANSMSARVGGCACGGGLSFCGGAGAQL